MKNLIKKTNIKTISFWVILIVVLDFATGYFLVPKKIKDIATIKNLNNYYQHGFNANTKGTNYYGNLVYPIATNSMGMIDAYCRTVAKEDNSKHRILFLGDSFVEGVGYPYEQTFCGYLTNMVDTQKIEILNAGVASFSPKLYYLRLKYLLEQEQLKVNEVFCFIDYSDIGDELVYEDFKPVPYSAYEEFKTKIKLFIRKYSLITHLYLSIKAQTFVSKNNNDVQAESIFWQKTNNRFLEKCPDYFFIRSNWHSVLTQNNECVNKGINSMFYYTEKLNDLCKKNKINLQLVIYPYPGHIDNSKEDLNAILNPFIQLAKNNNLNLINLYLLFVSNDINKSFQYQKKYFIPNDGHWNVDGHKLVARYLYPKIANNIK